MIEKLDTPLDVIAAVPGGTIQVTHHRFGMMVSSCFGTIQVEQINGFIEGDKFVAVGSAEFFSMPEERIAACKHDDSACEQLAVEQMRQELAARAEAEKIAADSVIAQAKEQVEAAQAHLDFVTAMASKS